MDSAILAPTATITESTDAITQARAAGLGALEYLQARGYVQDVTDEKGLRQAFADGVVTAYVGFDPTATSLHAGHLLGIMMLATLQRFGHRPIALGGGGTAMVGDPSGKTSTRALIAESDIERNLTQILNQFDRHLDFQGGRFQTDPPNPAALLLNNADWLLPLRYIEFLRDIGRHFSVNEMLAAETYRNRLETGLNFVEFNYRLVQSYDFLHLYREYGCTLQMGGSDQWGNITAGVELVRKAEGGKAFGLVCPLLTTSSGVKMGKTEGNSVWLDPQLFEPFQYFQYWINVDDGDVGKLLKLYTFLPDDHIRDLTGVEGAALRDAKQTLAYEATALAHGREAADQAREAAQVLFSSGRPTADDTGLPTVEISARDLTDEFTVADAFVRAGLASSRGDARRTANQGGLSIDEERLPGVDEVFSGVLGARTAVLLRAGKKRYMRVVIT